MAKNASTPHLKEVTQRNVKLVGQMEAAANQTRTFGERIADVATAWVGSWTFLIVQSVLLGIWVILNLLGTWKSWDPYPFVLLNLVLSFQAAFATPIILMSQNRQTLLAERRNHLDLQINLLAEQENTKQMRLLTLLCEKAGISIEDPLKDALEEATNPQEILEQIEADVECHTGANASKDLSSKRRSD